MTQSQLIAANILKTRERLNFSQDHVAAELGMSQAGYGKIERGECSISTDRLKQIADVFGICFSVLWPYHADAYKIWDIEKILVSFKPKTFEDCQKIAYRLAHAGQLHHDLVFALFHRLPAP